MKKISYMEKAIAWTQKKQTATIRSTQEGFEDPKVFTNTKTQEEIQAHISYTTDAGAKHFTEVALKRENKEELITRWKLLSLMASLKKGKLHLLTPRGHKSFTERLVENHNINAVIHSL